MGHKVLIDGTAYEVSGGRCLVEGTGYDIKKGRTLVEGTGYDIVFSGPCTVTITGNGSNSYAYVTINGERYLSAATVEVEAGTTMSCYAKSKSTLGPFGTVTSGGVMLNGTRVSNFDYTHTIEKNISVTLSISSASGYGSVEITEE